MNNESNIVELPKPETETAAPALPKLSVQTAIELGGAFAKLQELAQSKVLSPTSAAERRGLENFVAENLRIYGAELLGSWFIIRQEYEPMLQTINRIARRLRGSDSAQ